MEKPILILGGTGKTGRRIVERLMALKVPVRVCTTAATGVWSNLL